MQISKQVVIGACLAMVALIGGIAFLLGRESARHHTPAPVVAAPGAPAAAGGDPWADSPSPPPATDLRGPAPAPSPSPSAPPMPTPAPAPGTRAPVAAGDADEAAQVHEYFLKVSEIQAGPSGDPNEFANKLLASSVNGDTSGFDQLETSGKTALAAAQAITPPEPCAAYHAKLLQMLGDTLTMLGQLKTALSGKDTNALTALLPTAQAMQSQATALESEEREIKRRYGL